jgi:hypothetical protein
VLEIEIRTPRLILSPQDRVMFRFSHCNPNHCITGIAVIMVGWYNLINLMVYISNTHGCTNRYELNTISIQCYTGGFVVGVAYF